MGWIWWIIILAVIFFVIRGIFRAMSGPRMMPPGYGGGPGYGGPGYGGGGTAAAWRRRRLLERPARRPRRRVPRQRAVRRQPELRRRRDVAGDGGASTRAPAADAGGWQSDAGQIDTSNVGGASWGDSGGGGGTPAAAGAAATAAAAAATPAAAGSSVD